MLCQNSTFALTAGNVQSIAGQAVAGGTANTSSTSNRLAEGCNGNSGGTQGNTNGSMVSVSVPIGVGFGIGITFVMISLVLAALLLGEKHKRRQADYRAAPMNGRLGSTKQKSIYGKSIYELDTGRLYEIDDNPRAETETESFPRPGSTTM